MAKRAITDETFDTDGLARFDPDSSPGTSDPVEAEWIQRQLRRVQDAFSKASDGLLFVFSKLADHLISPDAHTQENIGGRSDAARASTNLREDQDQQDEAFDAHATDTLIHLPPTGGDEFEVVQMFSSTPGDFGWSRMRHDELSNRNNADAHAQSAISGRTGSSNLAEDQGQQDDRLTVLETTKAFMVAPYTPNQAVARGAMVYDEGWLMHANKDTDERAAPQGAGNLDYLYRGTDPVDSATAKTVLSGNRWSFLVPASISGYRIYAISGFRYSVYIVRNPDTINELMELPGFTASSTGWQEFGIAPSIFPAGTVLELMALVNEPDDTPTTWGSNWDYQIPNNPAIPAAGEIIQSSKEPGTLFVSYLASGGTDRETELRALTPGDIVRGAGMTWVIQVATPDTAYIEFVVTPAQQGSPGGVQRFEFDTVTATPIQYVEDTDYWLVNTFPDVTAEGLLGTDSASPVLNDSAYGTDILVQNVNTSDDWDLMARST